jgi:hypothetical protein
MWLSTTVCIFTILHVATTLNALLVGTNIFLLKKGIQEWELAPPAKEVQPPQQIILCQRTSVLSY